MLASDVTGRDRRRVVPRTEFRQLGLYAAYTLLLSCWTSSEQAVSRLMWKKEMAHSSGGMSNHRSSSFSPSGDNYFLGTDGGGPIFFTPGWLRHARYRRDLVANGVAFDHGATEVSADLTDTLSRRRRAGQSAVID